MGIGYPGSSFFEKMGPDLSEENISKLRDNSTEKENKELKNALLNKMKEKLKNEIDPYGEENWEEKIDHDTELIIDDNIFPIEMLNELQEYRPAMSLRYTIKFLDNIEIVKNVFNEYLPHDCHIDKRTRKIYKMEIVKFNKNGVIINRNNLYGTTVVSSMNENN